MNLDYVGVGIAGCGDLTQRAILPHLAEPDVCKKVRVAAVFDVDVSRAEAASKSFQVPQVAASYAELLELPAVDMVIVASPI